MVSFCQKLNDWAASFFFLNTFFVTLYQHWWEWNKCKTRQFILGKLGFKDIEGKTLVALSQTGKLPTLSKMGGGLGANSEKSNKKYIIHWLAIL